MTVGFGPCCRSALFNVFAAKVIHAALQSRPPTANGRYGIATLFAFGITWPSLTAIPNGFLNLLTSSTSIS